MDFEKLCHVFLRDRFGSDLQWSPVLVKTCLVHFEEADLLFHLVPVHAVTVELHPFLEAQRSALYAFVFVVLLGRDNVHVVLQSMTELARLFVFNHLQALVGHRSVRKGVSQPHVQFPTFVLLVHYTPAVLSQDVAAVSWQSGMVASNDDISVFANHRPWDMDHVPNLDNFGRIKPSSASGVEPIEFLHPMIQFVASLFEVVFQCFPPRSMAPVRFCTF
jgi:hypothetical protein